MKKAFLVPHPPIILPEVGRGEEEKIHESIAAYKQVAEEIAQIKPETIILSSPHAPYYADAFYMARAEEARGDLRAFGVRGVEEKVEMDRELCEEVLKTGRDLPIYYGREEGNKLDHGTLIPLRFIKARYEDFKLVRLGLSTLPARDHYKMGMALARAAEKLGRKCLYVASGDLSHVLKAEGPYGYREAGPAFDAKILDILERAAFDELLEISPEEADEAAQCGLGSLQMMAGYLDGCKVRAKKYSYQGSFGVGYGIFSFTGCGEDPGRHFLDWEIQTDPYIELARAGIRSFVEDGEVLSLPEDVPRAMREDRAGCFVSLHKFGQLRGCIGTIGPSRDNLGEEIIANAISSASRDPRFPPLKKEELKDLDISVDILGRPEPVRSLEDLDAKVYGVIVTSGFRRGLLLPNLEGVHSPREQIAIALQKAGIGPYEDFQVERFKVVRHEYK